MGEAPLSLVVDDLGIYYDATRASRLEMLLQEGGWQTPELLQRAASAIKTIRQYRISKYNHAPLLREKLPGEFTAKILVIDQTFGDSSVTFGCAGQASFRQMLDAALAENPEADIIVKTHPDVIAGKKKGYFSAADATCSRVHLLAADINPLSLLEQVEKVYTVSSQLGFEALLCDKPVKCYGIPFYAGWGLTEDLQSVSRRTARRTLQELFAAACLLYPRYLNPDTGQRGELEDLLAYFARYSQLREKLPGSEMVCGNFHWWKRRFVRKLLTPVGAKISFAESELEERAAGLIRWGGKQNSAQAVSAAARKLPVLGMEDGFIRSVGLGADLVLPLSLVLDSQGIYFDPRQSSELENILENAHFSAADCERGRALQQLLVDEQISKYSVGEELAPRLSPKAGQKVLLVPGQVEDDASIECGCVDISTNLALLKEVRRQHPQAYILFKQHPDVISHRRKGAIDDQSALQYCDQLVTEFSMPACLQVVDEVHTLTSLTGFEALLHGKTVVTYGLPFYAGWGLTSDRHRCARRTSHLSLDELVVGTLIRYPLYIDPQSKQLISVERAVEILRQQKQQQSRKLSSSVVIRLLRQLHGLYRWNFG